MATQQFTGGQGKGAQNTRHDAKSSVDKAAGSGSGDALQPQTAQEKDEFSNKAESDGRENTSGEINERLPDGV
ncbi:MAG TPA: hypothetical protein VFQ50_06175 [Flavobacterium sp.]|jgi:hypothetical protein|nr:hypothetical protein [Flavobacterium sp.]